MSQAASYYLRRAVNRVRDAVHEWDLPPTARAVRPERLTYLSPRKIRRLDETVSTVLQRGTPGDILEFGVALGGSAIILAQHAVGDDRAFHGFDVFGMIPPPTSDKDDTKSRQRYEIIASGQSKGIRGETYYGYRRNLLEDVRTAFARHGVPVNDSTIVLHKGLFEKTWPDYNGRTIAFVHIDCDWYDPVRFCLSQVANRIAPGGVIVLDDYHDYGGCRTATDEFLLAHREFTLADGANVILERSRSAA